MDTEILAAYGRACRCAVARGAHCPIRTARHIDEERGALIDDNDRALARFRIEEITGRVVLRLC